MTFKGGIKYNDVFKVFLMPPRVKEKGDPGSSPLTSKGFYAILRFLGENTPIFVFFSLISLGRVLPPEQGLRRW